MCACFEQMLIMHYCGLVELVHIAVNFVTLMSVLDGGCF
jgi:hypothetical protein